MHIDNCPVQRFIPIWLVVTGVTSCLMQFISLLKRVFAKQPWSEDSLDVPDIPEAPGVPGVPGVPGMRAEQPEQMRENSCCQDLLGLFNLVWFIIGGC